MQCGDIRYEVDFKKFNENFSISMIVKVKETYLKFVDPLINDYTINEINKLITKDMEFLTILKMSMIKEKIFLY